MQWKRLNNQDVCDQTETSTGALKLELLLFMRHGTEHRLPYTYTLLRGIEKSVHRTIDILWVLPEIFVEILNFETGQSGPVKGRIITW